MSQSIWQWERYHDVIRIHNYLIDEAQTRKLSFKSQNNENLQASDTGRSIQTVRCSEKETASERNSTFRRFVSIDSNVLCAMAIKWRSTNSEGEGHIKTLTQMCNSHKLSVILFVRHRISVSIVFLFCHKSNWIVDKSGKLAIIFSAKRQQQKWAKNYGPTILRPNCHRRLFLSVCSSFFLSFIFLNCVLDFVFRQVWLCSAVYINVHPPCKDPVSNMVGYFNVHKTDIQILWTKKMKATLTTMFVTVVFMMGPGWYTFHHKEFEAHTKKHTPKQSF